MHRVLGVQGAVNHASLTSNPVTRLYQAKGITPEITAVSDFISSLLATDCAGEKDLTFLTLRVGVQPRKFRYLCKCIVCA